MTSIHLTKEQTARYESEGPEGPAERREQRVAARAKANATGKTCEIYAAAGYVLDVACPDAE